MSNIEEVKKYVKKMIRLGFEERQITRAVDNQFKSLSESIIDEIVSDVIHGYPNYGFIQKIVRSKIVCDAQGDNQKIILLDEVNRSIDEYDRSRVKEVLDAKFDLQEKMHSTKYEYRPLEPGMLLVNKDHTYTYNTYVPPKWQEDWFYTKGLECPEKIIEIPAIYNKFLTHLVGNSEESEASREYIIKWLANGLKRKNYCILTTIGKQGIGKGVLGNIMKGIYGDPNYYEGGDRMFKGTFNSQIENKRLVYCDEITIKEREDEDRLKLVVNDYIEIEKKGIDAKTVRNYASFYISSNHMDSIVLTADDRRFSIVELTDEKLLNAMTPDEIRELLNEENIRKFASYLWHYEVDEKEMAKVFVTARTAEVRAMGLKEWEEWFVFNFCVDNKGKIYTLDQAKTEIKEKFGYSKAAGRGKFMELQSKYPDVFKVVYRKLGNNEKQVWCVEVSE